MALDFLGNEIEVGHRVVFMQKHYRNFLIGTVKSIADKTLLVEHPMTNGCSTVTKQLHKQVIVIKSNNGNQLLPYTV